MKLASSMQMLAFLRFGISLHACFADVQKRQSDGSWKFAVMTLNQ